MNRHEHRALRAIEKNLEADDPELAGLFRSSGSRRRRRMYWFAGSLAVPLLLLGFSSGDAVILLTGVLLAMAAVLGWTAQAFR
jgi:hypothetical protein